MSGSTLYLVRLGEISLKGLNRGFFERRLKQNVKAKLKPYHSEEHKQKGRLYFDISDECPASVIDAAFEPRSESSATRSASGVQRIWTRSRRKPRK